MKAIRSQRFRGYRDSGWIDLQLPMILLLGTNSSGKSAIRNSNICNHVLGDERSPLLRFYHESCESDE
ncbi:MAG: hypothetical protein U9Q68_04530 [Euryarchaeota archaeon]|nr:hypothetical protein [Euryarchaeota archaeon]